jgi:HEAT repeat protein
LLFGSAIVRADEGDDALAKRLASTVRDPRLGLWARVEAARTLEKLGPRAAAAMPDLIAQLDRLKGREHEPLQEAVVDALGQIGSPGRSALPVLARTTGRSVDIDQAIKRSTTQILTASDAQDIAALTSQLTSRDSSMRLRAAKALGNLGLDARTAVPDLVAVLADPDGDVRRAAVSALRLIQPDVRPGEPIVRSIVMDLADPDPGVRAAAARLLGRLGSAAVSAAPALEALLADPDSDVRRAAADALAKVARP